MCGRTIFLRRESVPHIGFRHSAIRRAPLRVVQQSWDTHAMPRRKDVSGITPSRANDGLCCDFQGCRYHSGVADRFRFLGGDVEIDHH